jgi:hypothetical protein
MRGYLTLAVLLVLPVTALANMAQFGQGGAAPPAATSTSIWQDDSGYQISSAGMVWTDSGDLSTPRITTTKVVAWEDTGAYLRTTILRLLWADFGAKQ